MTKCKSLALLLSILTCLFVEAVQPVTAAPLLAVDALPGFPRTEPGTVDFASPAVVDINLDGNLEVFVADSGGCIWGWDNRGNALPGFPLKPYGACGSRNRINSFAIGDIDGDPGQEIVAGGAGDGDTSGHRGKVYAWNPDGRMVSGWPREMDWNTQYAHGTPEVYTVALANVSGGPALEVLAGTNNSVTNGGTEDMAPPNLYAWSGNGALLKGFPVGYRRAAILGMLGAGDLNNDTCMEIIAPRDHRWLHAYNYTGQQVTGWPAETFVDPVRTAAGSYVEFTRNAPVVADLNGDGRNEVVAAGRVKLAESTTGGATVIVNSAVMALEPDGTRMSGWGTARLGDGPPLVDVYWPSQAPAIADINKDGQLDVVVALMDGTIRAFRANGQQLWKYNYANGKMLFASEPVIGDVNGDGNVDIVFGTYAPDGTANASVGLLALDHQGAPLSGFPLPLSNENGAKRGIRGAPALADLNGDGFVDILAGSWSGVLYAWNLSARYNPELMPWPTGRHDNQRSGFYRRPPRLLADSGSTPGGGDPYPAAGEPAVLDLAPATSRIFLPILGHTPAPVQRLCP